MPQEIQIIKPLMRAWGMTIRLLFRPLSIHAWIVFGLLVWLTTLGEYLWISPNYQFSFWFGLLDGPDSAASDNAWLIKTVIRAAVIAVTIPLLILLVWVRSRAVFCLLKSVAANKPQVLAPFKEYAPEADSYFRWSLVFLAVWVVTGLAVSFVGVLFSLPEVTSYGLSVWSSKGTFWAAFLGGILTVILGFACTMLESIIAPVMFLHRKSLPAAAVIAWENIIKPHLWAVILIYLIRLGFYTAMAVIFGTVMLFTFCCLCGLAPLIGAIVLLPFFMLPSVFSLTFIDQIKPDFEVFKPAPGEYFCPHCDYNLSGNPMARKCPECGNPLTPRPDLVGFNGENVPGHANVNGGANAPSSAAGSDEPDNSSQQDVPRGPSVREIRENLANRGYDEAIAPIDLDEPANETPTDNSTGNKAVNPDSPDSGETASAAPPRQRLSDEQSPIEIDGDDSKSDQQNSTGSTADVPPAAQPERPRVIEPPTLLPEPGKEDHDRNRLPGYRGPHDNKPDSGNSGSIL